MNHHTLNIFITGVILSLLIVFVSSLFAGEKKLDQLSGITPYGLKIPLVQNKFKRKNFTLTILYSDKLSDNTMSKYMKIFFKELCSRARRAVYARDLKQGSMKIVISNCRFCKIGYCRTIGKKRIQITGYKNKKKIGSLTFSRHDIIDQKKYIRLVKETVSAFFH